MRLIQELEKAKGEMVKGMLDEAFERASNVANDPGSIQYDTAYVAYELMNEILDKKKKKLLPDEEKQRKEGEARFLEEERMKEEARRLEQQKLEEEKRRSEEERKKKEKSSLTKEEAVQLVIEMTGMTPAESFFVEYDHHTLEGHYVIHLYEVVIDDPETREGHTATYGWYGVVPDTGEVYDYMER
jgi:Skp family chaperone for outer membrane proteins